MSIRKSLLSFGLFAVFGFSIPMVAAGESGHQAVVSDWTSRFEEAYATLRKGDVAQARKMLDDLLVEAPGTVEKQRVLDLNRLADAWVLKGLTLPLAERKDGANRTPSDNWKWRVCTPTASYMVWAQACG